MKEKNLFRTGKSIILIIGIALLEIILMPFSLAITSLFFDELNSLVLSNFLTSLSMLAILWFYLYKLENESYAAIGLNRPIGNTLHLIWQIPISAIIATTIPPLLYRLIGVVIYDSMKESFLGLNQIHLPILILGLVSIGIFRPIIGEFQKRKLTNDVLRTKVGTLVAIILNSVIWMLITPSAAPRLYLFFFGLIANILYFRYKSLWPPIIFTGIVSLLEISGGILKIASLLV